MKHMRVFSLLGLEKEEITVALKILHIKRVNWLLMKEIGLFPSLYKEEHRYQIKRHALIYDV